MSVTLSTWHFVTRAHEQHTRAHVTLDARWWADPSTRLLTFDRLLHEAEDRHGLGFAIELTGEEPRLSQVREQLTTRYQRLFTRRNRHSECASFDALLSRHAALHDRTKPLVRADHDHALDVWQWTLRLSPDASLALQTAALFHDIERLVSEPDQRIEHNAPDYLAFKQRHAARGADMVGEIVRALALEEATSREVVRLVERHEQPAGDPELDLLNEADALSFFALNSPGYLAYFGPEQTQKKVAYTLGRMRSPRALGMLRAVRLEPEIASFVAALQPT